MLSDRPIVVVGAGAAGLVAAIFAARQSRRVVLVERTADGGRKILISGGGRCNILPRSLEPERFVSDSPVLVRRLLRSWPLVQQRAFFEEDLDIPLKLEAETGKYFPVSDRARDVRDALVNCARTAGVEIQFDTRLEGLHLEAGSAMETGSSEVEAGSSDPAIWRVKTSNGEIVASAVILATGGRSVPTTGSDGAGLDLLKALGHTILPTYPALTPLVADPPVHAALSGISLTVRVRARNERVRAERSDERVERARRGAGDPADKSTEALGGFLFTHRGYSGPSVLDISHVAVRSRLAGGERAVVRVRWSDLDQDAWLTIFQKHAGLVLSALGRKLPSRLAERLILESGIPQDRKAAELRKSERTSLVENLTSYELPWTGDEGYKKAEVTGGGVALNEVDPRTLESRLAPGLFLCGELLDAFGPIGGHNFAWAWATGRAAGLGAARTTHN